MWGRRRKRSARLPKQLSLGLLEDAMGRAEQRQEDGEPAEAEPYPGSVPSPAAPAERAPLLPADVPVDNSAEPPAGDPAPPRQRQRRAERTGESTRRGSLG
jgi:hypothetical protein